MASVKETLQATTKAPSRLSQMFDKKSYYFIILIIAVVLGVALYFKSQSKEDAPKSSVNMGSVDGTTSRDLVEIDPATRSALDAANEMAANKALAKGTSSIKPEFREDIPAKPTPATEPAPEATSRSDELVEDLLKTGNREKPISSQKMQRQSLGGNNRNSGKSIGVDRFEAMERIASRFNAEHLDNAGSLAVVAAERRPDDVDFSASPREQEELSSVSPAVSAVPMETVIRAYRSVYAKLNTRATTDVPGPMIVELLEGPLKGARLEGRMAIMDQGFAINFTQMEFEEEMYAVNAVAVDPDSLSPNVATEHKSRFWKRNVRLLAASFAENWLGAIAKSGTTVVIGNGGSTTVEDEPDAGDALAAGGAGVAREIANDWRSDAKQIKPMYGRPANTGLGVLFLSPVEMPKGVF